MSTTLPEHLPRTLALFVALPLLAFGAGAAITEAVVGRPSSTAAVGYVLFPIVAVGLSCAAYTLGVPLRWFWRRCGWVTWESPIVERTLLIALALASGIACVAGCLGSMAHAAAA